MAIADVACRSVDVRLPCAAGTAAEARHLVVGLCERCGVRDQLLSDVALAVSEAAANAMTHAYPRGVTGDVDLWASVDDDALTVVLRDYGTGPSHDAGRCGLGLGVMRAASDSCEVEPARPGTCVRMRFRLHRAGV